MSLRAWALRRLMGRLRITDDVVRYLSTFQRLGETVEVQLPGELIPVGARTASRALRPRDAVQRAYAVQGADELVVVEVENRSRLPFALALAVRPYNPEGLAVVERIGLHDDHVVTVDGRPALLFPKPPSLVAASTFHDGDV